MEIIYLGGVAEFEVPVGEKVAINSENGEAVVYYNTSPNSPEEYYEATRVNKSEVELGTFTAIRKVRVESISSVVYYDVAVSPSIEIGGYPSELKNLTNQEILQLQNINSTSITAAAWGHLGVLNQNLATTDNVTFNTVGSAGFSLTSGAAISGAGNIFMATNTHFRFTNTSFVESLRLDVASGSFAIGGTGGAFGGGTNVLSLYNGTAPTSGVADSVICYSKDLSAGNTMLGIRGEGDTSGTGTPTQDRTLAIEYNGSTYYLLAATSAT